jgi:hypothetical protein
MDDYSNMETGDGACECVNFIRLVGIPACQLFFLFHVKNAAKMNVPGGGKMGTGEKKGNKDGF